MTFYLELCPSRQVGEEGNMGLVAATDGSCAFLEAEGKTFFGEFEKCGAMHML